MLFEPDRLQDLHHRATSYLRQARRIRYRALVIGLIAILIIVWGWQQARFPAAGQYYLDGTQWIEISQGSVIRTIDAIYSVNGGADLWYVYGDNCSCLSRHDDTQSKWIYDYSRRLVKEGNVFQALLPQEDGTAWSTGDGFLMYFDREQWSLIRADLPKEKPVQIVQMGANDLIILYEHNQFVRASRNRWTPLALPGDFSGEASLARDNQGLWLAGDGLWHLAEDTDTWMRVTPAWLSNGPVRLWNAYETELWVTTPDGFKVGDPTQARPAIFDNWTELGLPANTVVHAVIGQETPLYIVTDAGVIKTSGEQSIIQFPTEKPVHMAALYRQHLYVATDGQPSLFFRILNGTLYAAVVSLALSLGFGLMYSVPLQRFNAVRSARSHKYLMSLLPSIPEYANVTPPPGKSVATSRLRMVGYFFMMLILGLGIGLLKLPSWLLILVVVFSVVTISAIPASLRSRRAHLDADSRAHMKRNRSASIPVFVSLFAVVATISYLPRLLTSFFHDALAAWLLSYLVAFVLARAVVWAMSAFAFRYTWRALRTGAYEKALGEIEQAPRYVPHTNRLMWRGAVLQTAGRMTEAKEVWLETITEYQHQAPAVQALILCNLASTADALGQTEEAERYYRGALEIAPDLTLPYVRMLSWMVKHQAAPEDVRALRNIMPPLPRKPMIDAFFLRHEWAYRQAILANVAAYIGEQNEANRLLKSAFKNADPAFHAGKAEIYLIAGEILKSRGHIDKARQAWKKAAALDPNGASGKTAQEYLAA